MVKRMLFDAGHPEETRVVILDGNRLEEFDYESAAHKTLKGNIYLAKVTRVEPSLQAAFVDYGGNRHGFLPFGDIHPDYYRIPIADREALIAEERTAADDGDALPYDGHDAGDAGDDETRSAEPSEAQPAGGEEGGLVELDEGDRTIDVVGGDEREDDEDRRRSARLRRHYKIQEVIKRRQIMLVQVTKEERGNKGAAMTTYISLAGRYCVLMPNTARGGGISRKITSAQDRRRLKGIIEELAVPEGMAVIVRTAGIGRSKAEIKRDHEFLTRSWDDVRERTLSSRAPALIHEEANLITRTIRDSYTRDIEEVLVDGEDAYRAAKEFMKQLMPSHSRRVQLYREKSPPLFHKFQVETQLDALHSPIVRLKSGGYLVINTTEALVAIDVNSGRSTRERHIEETAAKTNLEAASEIARQLRLRDLAGLIVIDFIDMEDRRNNAAVERRLKEAMRLDRARVQIGRISQLGLLELSRQRLRPSLFELNMVSCPTCSGHGFVRSVESSALHILREIEDEGIKGRSAEVLVRANPGIAFYVLNHKRDTLDRFERDYGMCVLFQQEDGLLPPEFKLETTKRLSERPAAVPQAPVALVDLDDDVEDDEADTDEEEVVEADAGDRAGRAEAEGAAPTAAEDDEAGRRRRRGRRGGRRRGRRRGEGEESAPAAAAAEDAAAGEGAEAESADADVGTGSPGAAVTEEPIEPAVVAESAADGEAAGDDTAKEEAAGRRRRRPGSGRSRRRKPADGEVEAATAEETAGETVSQPASETRPEAATADETPPPAEAPPEPEPEPEPMPDLVLDVQGGPEPDAVLAEEPVVEARGNGAAVSPEPEPELEPDIADTAPEAPDEPEPAPRIRRGGRRGWWQRLVE